MLKAEKILDGDFAEQADFEQWDWGNDDLEPLLSHIRTSTAKVIAGQIQEDCEGWFSENDGLFNVVICGDFIVSFDVLKALGVGQIQFEDLDTLKNFTAKIDAVAANLHKAVKYAEEALAEKIGGEPEDPPPVQP